MQTLIIAFGVLAVGAVPAGDAKIQLPNGPAPLLQMASAVDAERETLIVFQVIVKKVPYVERVQVTVDGVVREELQTKYGEVQETRQTSQTLKGARFMTAAGKTLSTAAALQRLKPGTVLLVSADGREVAPAYLGIVNPETIVLIPGPAAPQGPPRLVPPASKN